MNNWLILVNSVKYGSFAIHYFLSCFLQLQNELDSRRRATEFALRKRNHHEEQARDELEWQIKNVSEPIVSKGFCVLHFR